VFLSKRVRYVRLSDEAYNELKKLSNLLGLNASEIVNSLVHAASLYGRRLKDEIEVYERSIGVSKGEAWNIVIHGVLDKGFLMSSLSRYLLKMLEGEDLGYDLEDCDWLKDFKGLWMSFVKLEGGSPWGHEVYIQLQRDGDAYVEYRSIVGFKGDLKDEEFDKIVYKLKKALEELLEKDEEFSEAIMDIEDCGDLTEFKIDISADSDMIAIEATVYTTDWECIPSLKLIEKMFRKIYGKAKLESYILQH